MRYVAEKIRGIILGQQRVPMCCAFLWGSFGVEYLLYEVQFQDLCAAVYESNVMVLWLGFLAWNGSYLVQSALVMASSG